MIAFKQQVSVVVGSSQRTRGVKRPRYEYGSLFRKHNANRYSTEMSVSSDKENHAADLELPKKRVKTAMGPPSSSAAGRATRTGSRKVNPSQVLSPKSHNSRTVPHAQSPLRVSPPRSYLARPISPAKPMPAAPSASTASVPVSKTRGVTGSRGTTKKPAGNAVATGSVRGRGRVGANAPAPQHRQAPDRTESRSSLTSDTSAGTTIVKKAAPGRKGVIGKVAGLAAGGKKAAAKKDAAALPPPSSGRVLRARK